MPYAAITYRVLPGHEDEIAEIFADFDRVDTPVFRDEAGEVAGRLLGTAVFVKDDVLVRIIHYEGDFTQIGKHMARQTGVHDIERRLAPLLARSRDTTTPQRFEEYFREAVMRCVCQLSLETHPAGDAEGGAGDGRVHSG